MVGGAGKIDSLCECIETRGGMQRLSGRVSVEPVAGEGRFRGNALVALLWTDSREVAVGACASARCGADDGYRTDGRCPARPILAIPDPDMTAAGGAPNNPVCVAALPFGELRENLSSSFHYWAAAILLEDSATA